MSDLKTHRVQVYQTTFALVKRNIFALPDLAKILQISGENGSFRSAKTAGRVSAGATRFLTALKSGPGPGRGLGENLMGNGKNSPIRRLTSIFADDTLNSRKSVGLQYCMET
jgi:hypothetical protein